MPSNLWLTNIPIPVQSIQIDANDGLGYRTTTFGQNLAVAYTTSGLKHWYYKVTLSNGQILYSHSKIIIEEGLVTTPHISGGSNLMTSQAITTNSTTPELGRQDITATLAYNGYGSAKVIIDYASADRKIRRPLIVVEGFDYGVLTNPEDEYGITSYDDFKFIIGNSQSGQLQSLLTNASTKQYDIIWVDWNNGTDYIQKNAYVLEEVIKWVNAEKLANGSSQSNVVLGQSMGGLIARYALKDMEDRSIPTQTSLYISHDAPHQGANFPIGYQYMSRHALHQYVQSPLFLLGGEVILPLFTDGVTPLDYLLLQNTPAAQQMLINLVGVNYAITNTVHDNWQNDLRLKGYPSMRKIAISNGNHCAVTQNVNAGETLLSVTGNYSTGWFTDIVLTTFPEVNAGIFGSISILTAEPGFLVGILPGGNKIKLDFKVNSLPSTGTNQIYKGKITYTKKILWLVNIDVTITDKSITSPSATLPFDYYPGGAIETGIRNSATASGGSFWQHAFVKYKMTTSTEPSFCFIPATSALDIGLGNVPLNNSDYLKKYNKTVPLVAPKVSPFDNFITSFQNTFILNFGDNIQSTNEHHIYLHLRNANWLAREIDNTPNNNETFDCTYMCSTSQISGPDNLCTTATYSVPTGGTSFNWAISQGSNLVTLAGNGTNSITLTKVGSSSGSVTMTATINSAVCGNITLTKTIWVGLPVSWSVSVIGSCELPIWLFKSYNTLQVTSWSYTINGVTTDVDGSEFEISPGDFMSPGQTKILTYKAGNACGFTGSNSISIKNPRPTDCLDSLSATSLSLDIYKVYPNPANDIIYIDLKDQEQQPRQDTKIIAELYNMMGELKQNVFIINNIATLSVNNLPKGIYILKINVDGNIENHQVVVE